MTLPSLKRIRDAITNDLIDEIELKYHEDDDSFVPTKRKNIPRVDCNLYPRLDMQHYFWLRRNDPTFETELRMTRASFGRLGNLIIEDLLVDENMAARRGGAISPEMRLYMALRFVSGGTAIDIKNHCRISKESFYLCLHKTLRAIINHKDLAIVFPQTENECKSHAEGFREVTHGAILNCVSVIDGLHIQIKCPPSSIGNVRAYYSGHHKTMGINVQAACDHLCRFTAVAVEAPGSMNDRLALKKSFMFPMIEKLPKPYVVIGDAAYEPTEHVVPVYYGSNKSNPMYDNFNYCASTGRIRIEMAFGLQGSKFLIYQKPLMCMPENIGLFILAIAQLHNFVINERIECDAWHPKHEYSHIENPESFFQPSVPVAENRVDPIPTEDEPGAYSIPGHSMIREEMAMYVATEGYVRPPRKKERV
jgi:hypothetical protein